MAGPQMRIVEGGRLEPSDREDLLRLLDRAFVDWPRLGPHAAGADHFDWKTRDFPGGTAIVIAEGDRSIVGMYGILQRRFLLEGVPRMVRDSVDLAVDPALQGRGVYRDMSRYAAEHLNPRFDLALGYVATPQSGHLASRMGYRPLANRLQILIKIFSARQTAEWARNRGNRLPPSILAAGVRAYDWATRIRYRPPAGRGWAVTTLDRFDGRIDGFFAGAREPFVFLQIRTMDYLNWRFADLRGGQFTIRAVENGNGILGYVVVTLSEGVGRIADLLTLPGRADVAESLIADAMAIFEGAQVHTALCWLPRFHPYQVLFRRAGFFDSRRSTGLAFLPIKDEPAFLDDPRAAIHLMIGDTDHV